MIKDVKHLDLWRDSRSKVEAVRLPALHALAWWRANDRAQATLARTANKLASEQLAALCKRKGFALYV